MVSKRIFLANKYIWHRLPGFLTDQPLSNATDKPALNKGGLILESVFLWLKSPKNGAKKMTTLSPEESAPGTNLAPFRGDLDQSEKLSEIKPPLRSQKSKKILFWQ